MSGKVLTIYNAHIPAVSAPPNLANGDTSYTAYFENSEGEQLVFQYGRAEKKGWLWHGDYSWKHSVEVKDGHCPLILSREETEWLQLVWKVATSHS